MPIPDYQTVMLPLLQLISERGPLKLQEARTLMADAFKLSAEERAMLLPSGKQGIMSNRVGWASTYLRKAGLLSAPSRGLIEITERGRAALLLGLTKIDTAFLDRYPEFVLFRNRSEVDSAQDSPAAKIATEKVSTPEETLERSFEHLKRQALEEILDRIKASTPEFFEQVVVDTVVGMGYGGSRSDAGKAIGRSGDEGIDGIINEDRLGLDVIFLQAKRWEGNISRPEIQKFAGALQGKRARKGIFITTSDFTQEARDFARNIDSRIILISGRQLAELMWEHNIGFNLAARYELKRVDGDYFSE